MLAFFSLVLAFVWLVLVFVLALFAFLALVLTSVSLILALVSLILALSFYSAPSDSRMVKTRQGSSGDLGSAPFGGEVPRTEVTADVSADAIGRFRASRSQRSQSLLTEYEHGLESTSPSKVKKLLQSAKDSNDSLLSMISTKDGTTGQGEYSETK